MSRITRYQCAVVLNDHILLIKQRYHKDGIHYWVIPGGGREE
jgi:8-oxo-dGTP pyrophosphatase MutT (NUDIX family)